MEYLRKEDIDFPTTAEYTKQDIQNAQRELLAMVKIVADILERNDIPYFIAFGTLIGAVRFGGFLPWDDDIDMFLFDETYDKAIACLENELPNHLIVHSEKNDPNYFLAWNSVKNTNTRVYDNNIYNPDNKLLKYRCLGVDMYRLKKMKPHQIPQYKAEEAIKFFKRKRNCGMITEEFLQEQLNKIENDLKLNTDSSILRNEEDVYCFILKLKNYFLAEHIFPLKKYKFEDIELYGPNNYDAVLTATFGDYAELPKYEERLPHLKKIEFY